MNVMPTDGETENLPVEVVDNRMRFLRLLTSPEPRAYVNEYEFASEVRITGELNYLNGGLILRLLTTEPNRDGLFKYSMSLAAPAEYRLPRYQASKDGYYFAGGGTDEVLSLSSLYLRCRFFPIATTFRGINGPPITKHENDFSYLQPDRFSDRFIFDTSDRNFVRLEGLFNLVQRLPENLHHKFANAVRLYALALKEIGVRDDQAFIHLVSSVEILAKDIRLDASADPLAEWVERLEEALSDAPEEAKSELANLINLRKSQLKVLAFLNEYMGELLPPAPAGGHDGCKIYREDLPNTVKRIYKARSKFLHEGTSMYMSMPRIILVDCDYDVSQGQSIDNRQFEPNDKLPGVFFFENLVRQCLLNYLERQVAAV